MDVRVKLGWVKIRECAVVKPFKMSTLHVSSYDVYLHSPELEITSTNQAINYMLFGIQLAMSLRPHSSVFHKLILPICICVYVRYACCMRAFCF